MSRGEIESRKVLIGVSGGIAAYKTAALVSQLVQSGLEVSVAMTPAAQQFVGEATFAALTGKPVASQLFQSDAFPLGAHIELAREAELFCVAPASADFLAKAAAGIADDLLSTLYLSFTGPVILAPAMNTQMWEKPAVQRNLNQLKEDGATIVDPESGWLSCREKGKGRMAEPQAFHEVLMAMLEQR